MIEYIKSCFIHFSFLDMSIPENSYNYFFVNYKFSDDATELAADAYKYFRKFNKFGDDQHTSFFALRCTCKYCESFQTFFLSLKRRLHTDYHAKFGEPCCCSDLALEILEINGFPGPVM